MTFFPDFLAEAVRDEIAYPIEPRYLCRKEVDFVCLPLLIFTEIYEKKSLSIAYFVNSFIDIVARNPQYDVEQKHSSSDDASQRVYLLVVSKGVYLIKMLSKGHLNSI